MPTIRSLLLGAAIGAAALPAAAADIDVMTQNQYLGPDLTPVVLAAAAQPFDPVAFNAAVVTALRGIAATRPGPRAQALAAEIAQRHPDVAALQEAYRFACLPYPGVPPQPGRGCDDPTIRDAFTDHLQDTLAALRGDYVLAGQVTNLNVPALPFSIDGVPALLGVVDRDAILVRRGLPAAPVDFAALGACAKPSGEGCNYQTVPPALPTPAGPIVLERGFLAVDVTVRERPYRVFTTHLEVRQPLPGLPETRLLQVGQAYELAATALGTWDGARTLLVLGDINSDPRDTIPVPPYPATLPWAPSLPVVPPYTVFVASGFTDAWTLRPQPGTGESCCQPEDLANRRSALYERIDMVFSLRAPSRVLDMRLLGTTAGAKTRPPSNGGLWPSDHAALAAKLQFD
jgi:hypothetical protein